MTWPAPGRACRLETTIDARLRDLAWINAAHPWSVDYGRIFHHDEAGSTQRTSSDARGLTVWLPRGSVATRVLEAGV